MKSKKHCYAIALLILIGGNTLAQPPKKQDKNPDENTLLEARRNHKQRIQEGIADGTLTKAEAKQLTQLENKIQQAMYKAKNNDGKIDEPERNQIKAMLLKQSDEIERLKRNDEKRKG